MTSTEAHFPLRGLSSLPSFRRGFIVAAAYDLLLGGIFFFFYDPIFDALDVAPPEHASYAHLAAAFIFVQGAGYALVALNPLRNVDLVRMGVLYKAVYSGLAVYYLARGELIDNLFAWFAVADVAFIVLFAAFLRQAGESLWPGRD